MYDFIVPVIIKKRKITLDARDVQQRGLSFLLCLGVKTNQSCATKAHCSHTRTPHLCLRHLHASVKKETLQELCN